MDSVYIIDTTTGAVDSYADSLPYGIRGISPIAVNNVIYAFGGATVSVDNDTSNDGVFLNEWISTQISTSIPTSIPTMTTEHSDSNPVSAADDVISGSADAIAVWAVILIIIGGGCCCLCLCSVAMCVYCNRTKAMD